MASCRRRRLQRWRRRGIFHLRNSCSPAARCSLVASLLAGCSPLALAMAMAPKQNSGTRRSGLLVPKQKRTLKAPEASRRPRLSLGSLRAERWTNKAAAGWLAAGPIQADRPAGWLANSSAAVAAALQRNSRDSQLATRKRGAFGLRADSSRLAP